MSDPLGLNPLFTGSEHAEEWARILRPVIEALPEAAEHIGPKRDARTVPVRELTFQALKPLPPAGWHVISFGQSPYPRIESATGIAHFDNALKSWTDKKFGSCVTMRCLIKAAVLNKYGGDNDKLKVDHIRKLLAEKDVVPPAEWFQALLCQGVLLLNAALSLVIPPEGSGRGARGGFVPTQFWFPVIEAIVDTILTQRAERGQGVVFAWWGGESLKTKKALKAVFAKHASTVQIEHVEWKNPAAMRDAFCEDPNVFASVNSALSKLKLPEVDWLPTKGWQESLAAAPAAKKRKKGEQAAEGACGEAHIENMGAFISETQELHQMYLERLKDGLDAKLPEMADLSGIAALPLLGLVPACKQNKLGEHPKHSVEKAGKMKRGSLSVDEAGAVHLYTTNCLYRNLNAALRDQDRSKAKQYFKYLRLFLHAVGKMPASSKPLYRGVGLDLSKEYPKGALVTWWAVSSCTPSLAVAKGFMSGAKTSTIFHIKPLRSVGIKALSQYQHEEEYLLAPGTVLRVDGVKKSGNVVEVSLSEVDCEPRVN